MPQSCTPAACEPGAAARTSHLQLGPAARPQTPDQKPSSTCRRNAPPLSWSSPAAAAACCCAPTWRRGASTSPASPPSCSTTRPASPPSEWLQCEEQALESPCSLCAQSWSPHPARDMTHSSSASAAATCKSVPQVVSIAPAALVCKLHSATAPVTLPQVCAPGRPHRAHGPRGGGGAVPAAERGGVPAAAGAACGAAAGAAPAAGAGGARRPGGRHGAVASFLLAAPKSWCRMQRGHTCHSSARVARQCHCCGADRLVRQHILDLAGGQGT